MVRGRSEVVPREAGPSKIGQAALGFKVRSGVARAAWLVGPADDPVVQRLSDVALSDPRSADSRQPYHRGFGELETDSTKIGRRVDRIRSAAADSVCRLLEECGGGHRPGVAGLVVGSLIDPATIANAHIRAHALEGRLFRSLLEELLRQHGLKVSVWVERRVYAEGAALLKTAEARLRAAIASLPHPAGSWRADDKLAALAARLALKGARQGAVEPR